MRQGGLCHPSAYFSYIGVDYAIMDRYLIRGFKVREVGEEAIHLQFADDTLFFLDCDVFELGKTCINKYR